MSVGELQDPDAVLSVFGKMNNFYWDENLPLGCLQVGSYILNEILKRFTGHHHAL